MTAPPLLLARYAIRSGSESEAVALAEAMAREQTLEVPSGAAPPAIEATLLGRVASVVPAATGPAGHDHADNGTDREQGKGARPSTWEVTLAYHQDLLDGSLTQFLNLVWGNISLMPAVRLVDLEIPERVLAGFAGPSLGIDGLRARVGATRRRALISGALKPVGLSSSELARLAGKLAGAGMDLIKDDHSLVDQRSAPFEERVAGVADAVAASNARTGGATSYFPNITGTSSVMLERAGMAADAGCGGVVISPGLSGLPAMQEVSAAFPELAIMAHPSHANSSPEAANGIAPEVLMGTLWRMAGADALIYVNAHGRFAWPLETCLSINARARAPLGQLRPAFPVPAGGVQADRVPHWLEVYGPDTLLLVGGSILEAPDVEARAARVVEAVRRGAVSEQAGG